MSDTFTAITVADAAEIVTAQRQGVETSGVDLARAHGTHYIEDSVGVYLMRDPAGSNRWVLDPTSISGEALDSTYAEGPENGNCECGRPNECERIASHMGRRAALPNGEELLVMLAAALGYELHPIS
ncbi:hypothetical protein QM616_22665 [Rhodococcus fascians]|uniref:hypothetical protein n=1 Tax=Rhodococcoides fascians TaxID=1828 RepID=UPI0024B6F6F6|nr:hypothetical protein [Rhodococcus fascians]MDJ0005531.1 hypothetical protein [Rhodococcus fascians]